MFKENDLALSELYSDKDKILLLVRKVPKEEVDEFVKKLNRENPELSFELNWRKDEIVWEVLKGDQVNFYSQDTLKHFNRE